MTHQLRRGGLVALALLALVGCSEDDGPSAAGGGTLLARTAFDEDLDGWQAGTHDTLFGSVVWLDREGGIVKLDGVGFDGDPNAWISREFDLPADASTMRLSTSAHDRGEGAVSLRIRLVDAGDTSHVLQDWTTLDTGDPDFEFVEQSLDISAHADQTVTIFLEIGDDDGGGNNQRYIDFVEFHR